MQNTNGGLNLKGMILVNLLMASIFFSIGYGVSYFSGPTREVIYQQPIIYNNTIIVNKTVINNITYVINNTIPINNTVVYNNTYLINRTIAINNTVFYNSTYQFNSTVIINNTVYTVFEQYYYLPNATYVAFYWGSAEYKGVLLLFLKTSWINLFLILNTTKNDGNLTTIHDFTLQTWIDNRTGTTSAGLFFNAYENVSGTYRMYYAAHVSIDNGTLNIYSYPGFTVGLFDGADFVFGTIEWQEAYKPEWVVMELNIQTTT